MRREKTFTRGNNFSITSTLPLDDYTSVSPPRNPCLVPPLPTSHLAFSFLCIIAYSSLSIFLGLIHHGLFRISPSFLTKKEFYYSQGVFSILSSYF